MRIRTGNELDLLKTIRRDVFSNLRYYLLISVLVVLFLAGKVLAGPDRPNENAGNRTLQIIRIAMVHALGQVNAKDARVAIDLNWTKHLANVFPGLDSQFEIFSDVESVVQQIKAERLHGLSLGITHFLQLRESVVIRPVFISSRRTQPLESYLLLVRNGITWERLIHQSQKRLMTEKMATPTIGRMWLETVLEEKQLQGGQKFFSEISSADKPARIILPVFFGQADVCLVPESLYQTMVELNPQIHQRLTVLERSPGFIKTIHCVTPQLPETMVDLFLSKGMKMEDTVDGRQLLLIFQVKKNFKFHESYLADSEWVYQKYRRLVDKR